MRPQFTYYHKIGDVTVFEVDGRVEIERDGSFTIYLQDILSDAEAPADEYFKAKIEAWLQSERDDLLEDLRNDAKAGFIAHDRETARDL